MAVYLHDNTVDYPTTDNQHMVLREKKHEYVYDENFPYRLQKKFPHNIISFLLHIFEITIAFPVCIIRYGLKIKGRNNLRAYKKVSPDRAMISISNHTAEWDNLFVRMLRGGFAEMPIWQEGAESSSGTIYRYAGGIVCPKHSPHGIAYSYAAMRDVITEGKWLHVFPEAACWPFYPALRNFEYGAFKLACETNHPILPIGVTYRKPTGIYKLFKKEPLATMTIGEPVCINTEFGKRERMDDLKNRCWESVLHIIGIRDAEENNYIRQAILEHTYTGK